MNRQRRHVCPVVDSRFIPYVLGFLYGCFRPPGGNSSRSAGTRVGFDRSRQQTSVLLPLGVQFHALGLFFTANVVVADSAATRHVLHGRIAKCHYSGFEYSTCRAHLLSSEPFSSFTLPRTLRYLLTEQGDRIPILAQELTISATESVEGHPVKLISVPWKTPASNAVVTPEDKTEKEPTSIPLDTMSNQDMDADYATFPIAWKRLQFRIATANNGRRKELQQHFVVRLKVVATLSTGAKVPICEAKSGAIIVRGRSPRNFQTRKDFPVGGSASRSRKNMQPPSLGRNSTSDQSLKAETSPEQAFKSFNFDQQDAQPPGSFPDWNKSLVQLLKGEPLPASAVIVPPPAQPLRRPNLPLPQRYHYP